MSPLPPRDDLYKVDWSGTLGTHEIFSYHRWATGDSGQTQETIIDALTDDVTNMLAQTVTLGPVATLGQAFPSWVAWTELKVSPWNRLTNKLTVGETPAYRTLTDVGVGTPSDGLPYQCAWSITTRSGLAHHKKYNRFSLPPLCTTPTDGQGDVESTVMDALALWWHLSMTSHDAGSPAVTYVNWNPSGGSVGDHPIIDLYLGSRIDTMRSRRNQAPETRVIDAM